MKMRNLLFAGAVLVLALPLAAAADERHSPDAHMDQNADRYRYTYDDGVCQYDYRYDFKELTDHLEQHGDCRGVPIERYRPQAAMTPMPIPTYPPPASAPPVAAPGMAAPAAPAPSVTVERPWPVVPPGSQ